MVIAHKKMLIRVLLITLGFFGTPALFRATGAEDHLSQIESPYTCFSYLGHIPESYDKCLSKQLGGKPYWVLMSSSEYQGHWFAETYVFKNGLRWQIDIAPRNGFEMKPENPSEVFAVRVELTYPNWWGDDQISRFQIKGVPGKWFDLKAVNDSRTTFEAYVSFTKSLAARLTGGEVIQIEAEQAGRTLIAELPSMSKVTGQSLMEPQLIADEVSRQIAVGDIPRSYSGYYGLKRKGDSFTLVVNEGDKPLAHWQLKTAQRTINYKSGAKYQGAMRAGKYHGKGRYTWSDGMTYNGDWVNGDRTGQGVYTWPDGRRYEGGFVKGQFSGKGIYSAKDGTRYEGGYKGHSKHGQGILIFPSGNRYEGDFVDGNRTGDGIFTWATGDEYRGEFLDNDRHGQGFYKSRKGWSYDGEWRKGERHGYGEYTSTSGQSSYREYYRGERIREPEPKVASQSSGRKKCGSYENPCEIPSDTGIDAFAKSLARAADQAFGSNQYGGYGGSTSSNRAAEIQAENERRWRAADRKLKREIYEAKVASDRRKKEREAKRSEYNRLNGTCDERLELDGSVKAWYYIWSSKVCGRWDCDGRTNEQVETRIFVSNLVYARKFDHENLGGGFYDQIRIQYKNKTHSASGIESNGFVCRGDARNARREFVADRSDNDRTYIFDVNLPEYP